MNDHPERGFTLIEMMIVLSIWGVMIVTTISLPYRFIQQVEADMFLRQFEEDLLFMQQATMTTNEDHRLLFFPSEKMYKIYRDRYSSTLITRQLPQHWDIQLRTLTKPIQFQNSGQILTPGKLAFVTPSFTYLVTFPFGKARFYVTEQS